MTRQCEKCGFINQDEYDFCAKCGNPLTENARPKNFVVVRPDQVKINKKAIILSYVVTILLSWGGVVLGILTKNLNLGVFTFFGFFMPFYLVQSRHPTIRKHGFIQLLISFLGIGISFYLMLV